MDLFQKTSQFDDFWKSYPRKVGKHAAQKAYLKAICIKPHEALMQALELYKASVKGKEPEYILHASTWLNGRRWQDNIGGKVDGEVLEKVSQAANYPSDADVWRFRLGLKGNKGIYKPGKFWCSNWGPRPESGYCDAPSVLLKEWTESSALK